MLGGLGPTFHRYGKLEGTLQRFVRVAEYGVVDCDLYGVDRTAYTQLAAEHSSRASLRSRAAVGPGSLAYVEFLAFLQSQLDLPGGSVREGARLDRDLGLDSLGRIEIALILVEMGVALEDSDLASWLTVDDVHFTYEQKRGR